MSRSDEEIRADVMRRKNLPPGAPRAYARLNLADDAEALLDRVLAAEAERDRLRELVDRAKQALVQTGYFTAGQVTDDIAPRIYELCPHMVALGPVGATQEAAE
jgi:hypothetical protein